MTRSPTMSIDRHGLARHPGYFRLIDGAVLVRAGIVALVLGTVLALSNQSDALFGPNDVRALPLAMVYITPFVVVTISQVLGIRRALADARLHGPGAPVPGGLGATMLDHGIPGRAFLLGLAAGSVNTAGLLANTGDVAALPVPSIAQAFILPFLFGLISQAISYRRAAARMNSHPFTPW